MDTDLTTEIAGLPSNEVEDTETLNNSISVSSMGQTTVEQEQTTPQNPTHSLISPSTIRQEESTSQDSIHQATSSPPFADENITETDVGQATELLSLDNYKRLKRSNPLTSSLRVNDGYGIEAWSRFSYWATEAWLYEFLAWMLSCYCFAGIVITLLLHRNQPIPEWPFDITINALVSALSTIMGSALLVPVSSTIGQAKWSWIVRARRKLVDIARYDEASRGPWGSVVLMMKLGIRDPVAFGAIITILALLIGPFLQQTTAVVLENRPVENSKATLLALNWWAEGLRTGSGFPRVKDDMVMAINRGLFFDGNHTDPFLISALQPRPQCLSGNCSFGTFESLAVCSECRDITEYLNVTKSSNKSYCENHNESEYTEECARWSLPNGHDSGWVDVTSGLLMSTNASRDPILLNPGLSILNLTALAPCWEHIDTLANRTRQYKACIGSPDRQVSGGKRHQAQECTLKWCVHKYESEMTNGVLQENIVSTTHSGNYKPGFMYDFSPPNSSVSYTVLLNSARGDVNKIPDFGNITTGIVGGKFSVHRQATDLVTGYLKSELEGFTSVNYTMGKAYVRRLYTANVGRSYGGESVAQNFDMTPLFETMALSMTSALRASQVQDFMGSDHSSDDDYNLAEDSWDLPTVWQRIETAPNRLVPVLRVRWGWVALPAALELATLLLLLYIVLWKPQNSLPIWKSSTLPLLLLGSEMHDAIGDNIPRHVIDMEELAERVSIDPEIAMGRAQRPVEKELPKLPWAGRYRRWKDLRRGTKSRSKGDDSNPTLGSYA